MGKNLSFTTVSRVLLVCLALAAFAAFSTALPIDIDGDNMVMLQEGADVTPASLAEEKKKADASQEEAQKLTDAATAATATAKDVKEKEEKKSEDAKKDQETAKVVQEAAKTKKEETTE